MCLRGSWDSAGKKVGESGEIAGTASSYNTDVGDAMGRAALVKDPLRCSTSILTETTCGLYLRKVGDVVGGPVAARQLLSHIPAGDQARDLLRHPQQAGPQILPWRELLQVQDHVPAHRMPFQASWCLNMQAEPAHAALPSRRPYASQLQPCRAGELSLAYTGHLAGCESWSMRSVGCDSSLQPVRTSRCTLSLCLNTLAVYAPTYTEGVKGSLVVVGAAVQVVQVGHPVLARGCQGVCNAHSLPAHLNAASATDPWSQSLCST